MPASIRQLFVSLGLLFAGHGLSQTLVPVFASQQGWSEERLGLLGSAYFLGFVIGCLTVPKLLFRVGHVRVFLVLTGVTAACILLLRDLQQFGAWVVLRMLSGWCLAAIYTTAESWINDYAPNGQRGRLISVYLLVSLLGMASGQVVFGMMPVQYLFALASLLVLLALIPVGLFCDDQPMAMPGSTFRLRSLGQVPLRARAVMFVSGAVMGSIWAMTPLVIEASHLDLSNSGMIMMTVIIGGAVFQLPVGMAADRYGRKLVTNALLLGGLAVSLFGVLRSFNHILELAVVMFLLGGASLSLYTMASSEANDRSYLSRVELATVLLLMNGVGSILGPLLTGVVMSWAPVGLFIVAAAMQAGLLLMLLRWQEVPRERLLSSGLEGNGADVVAIEDYRDTEAPGIMADRGRREQAS